MNQPMGMPAKLRPGRIWYLVSLLVFAAGVAWLVFGIVSVVNNGERVALIGCLGEDINH